MLQFKVTAKSNAGSKGKFEPKQTLANNFKSSSQGVFCTDEENGQRNAPL